MTDTAPPRRRSGRFWLYAPFLLLVVAALGWSAFWFVVRGRVSEAVDQALAQEQGRGRSWTCTDRSITGFPFRVELRCAALSLTSARWGETVRVETGPALALGQIYSPGLVIFQLASPLKATLPEGRVLDIAWTRLAASLAHREPQRVAIVVTGPNATLSAPGYAAESWRADTLEAHLRRNPTRPAEQQVVDASIEVKGSVLPALDALLGTTEPGDVDILASLSQAEAFRIGLNPDALEAWRNAGGQIEISRFVSLKGKARVEASGRLLIDQTHRPAGQIQAAIAGIDQIGGLRIGGLTAGIGSLLGGLTGAAPAPSATPGMTALPPLVLREGRAYLGPIRLPLQPLPALY